MALPEIEARRAKHKEYIRILKLERPEVYERWMVRKRARSKEYREENKRDLAKKGEEYRAANKASLNGKYKSYYADNKERLLQKAKDLRKSNPEKMRSYSRKWYAKNKKTRQAKMKEYAKQHPEGSRKRSLAWQKRNRPKVAQNTARRKALLRNQTPDTACLPTIQVFYETAARVSECLGIPHEVDHWIPLKKGGLHHHGNLWIIPAFYNRRKNQRVLQSREDIFKLAA